MSTKFVYRSPQSLEDAIRNGVEESAAEGLDLVDAIHDHVADWVAGKLTLDALKDVGPLQTWEWVKHGTGRINSRPV
jgi:hypothetical protein